ncbi:hypothetical protein Clacol_007106 [Clathrus columnatus]|uniref:F-box domain-containing protein n=1 Tax=Clathrus columnatus TaxID=1419009 RepID=A0AAV5AJ29_9AGAM|nr:hypothetical protein Clacol_007106 [Clathrus columnatus]
MSTHNLDSDILIVIFSFLSSSDLTSVALVNKSFNAIAVPRLYHTIYFRDSGLQKWPNLPSPFETILKRPELAIHVRCCGMSIMFLPTDELICLIITEISSLPRPPMGNRLISKFMNSCIESLSTLCSNIHTFRFIVHHPAFISILRGKKRLSKLQLSLGLDDITESDAEMLSQITGLHTLDLHQVPLGLCRRLPQWISNISDTLTTFRIRTSQHLDEALFIEMGLSRLSLLEKLAFPMDESTLRIPHFPKHNLPNLHIVGISSIPNWSEESTSGPRPGLLEPFFNSISDSPVSSIACGFANYADFVPDETISQIVRHFSLTLQRLSFTNADISEKGLTELAQFCKNLKQLTITPSPVGSPTARLTGSLSHSSSLKVLIIPPRRDQWSSILRSEGYCTTLNIKELFRCAPSIQVMVVGGKILMRDARPSLMNSYGPDNFRVLSAPINRFNLAFREKYGIETLGMD